MDNERTNGWPDDGRDIPPMGYGLNDTQPPPPTETERERNLRLATEPKITRPKEPCTECGKPTRYGLGHHNAQCSTCQRKIAADEANQLPRVVHPGAFAAPAAAGEMDPIKPSPPPCSPQSSPEPTQAEVNKRARELREQWDSDTLQARIAIDSERQGYKPNPRCPNCNRPMRATETGFRCDPCTDATPEPAECQACEFCTERGVCTQEDDGRCPIMHNPPTRREP